MDFLSDINPFAFIFSLLRQFVLLSHRPSPHPPLPFWLHINHAPTGRQRPVVVMKNLPANPIHSLHQNDEMAATDAQVFFFFFFSLVISADRKEAIL